MAATHRIEQLLHKMQEQGYWTVEEVREIYEMTGRDAGYIPEGTEDWMAEDGVPRAYDKPRRLPPEVERSLTPEERRGPIVAMGITEAEAMLKPSGEMATWPPPEADARIKTLEATVTDLMRRLKALEERVIDPSV